jgi:hypothetical protein
MNLFHLWGKARQFRSPPPAQQGCAALHKTFASATQRKPTYFRDHTTPYECLPLSHSLTPSPHIRRIACPRAPPLSSNLDSRATHARRPQRCLLCHTGWIRIWFCSKTYQAGGHAGGQLIRHLPSLNKLHGGKPSFLPTRARNNDTWDRRRIVNNEMISYF